MNVIRFIWLQLTYCVISEHASWLIVKVLRRIHQSFALLLCTSLWSKLGGHSLGFSCRVLWCSDWLKLLGWLATQNPVLTCPFKTSQYSFTSVPSSPALSKYHNSHSPKCPRIRCNCNWTDPPPPCRSLPDLPRYAPPLWLSGAAGIWGSWRSHASCPGGHGCWRCPPPRTGSSGSPESSWCAAVCVSPAHPIISPQL